MIDALVGGRSLPALQAALDLAEVGLRVAIAAPSGMEGVGDASERDPDGIVAAFMRRIAEPIEGGSAGAHAEAAPQFTPPIAPMLRSTDGAWLPQSSTEVFGIPAVPLASENIALLGGRGVARAYLDRLKPLLTVGKTREFGRLVRSRMGAGVLEKLVEPQVFERYGVGADEVDAAIIAPGLNEALSRTGALSSGVLAYSERHVARETGVRAVGGEEALREALLERLALYSVELLDSRLVGAEETSEGWDAVLECGERVEARALIADQGRSPRPFEPIATLIAEVLPSRARLCARMELPRPTWLPRGGAAIARPEGWAVRFESAAECEEPGKSDIANVLLSSEAHGSVQDVVDGAAEAYSAAIRIMAELLEESPHPADEWAVHSAQHIAAPYATLMERDGATARLEAFAFGHDMLLPVGRALHGDDLGAALEWSHTGAVALRRRLLGLEAE